MPALVKRALSVASESAAFGGFVSLLERFHRGRENLLYVLTYHRIDDPRAHPDLAPSTISATPAAFQRQMEHLAVRYRVVSMAEVHAACYQGAPLPAKAVLLTFDDAYQAFADHAWPIMRRLGLSATLFVPTAYPDHPQRAFWWDRVHHAIARAADGDHCRLPCGSFQLTTLPAKRLAEQQIVVWLKSIPHDDAMAWVAQLERQLRTTPSVSRVLNWNAIRQLAREGVEIGAHTQTHPLLHRVSPESAFAEIAGSLADLRRELGPVRPVFAYPGGKFNSAACAAVRRAGFELAFASRRGVNSLADVDRFAIRRNHLGPGTTPTLFRLRLLPWSVYLNRWRPVTGA